VPDRGRREDRHRALVKIVEFANDLAATPARDDRIVDHVAALIEVDLGRSPAIIRQLTEYYVKTGQSAKAYGLLDRWAEAVRARAGDDSPELAKIFSFTADVKHRERDFRRALAVCTDWIEYEQSARGRWARRTADAYLKMAEIAFDYEDFSAARANLDAGVRIADYWAWSSEDDYPARVRRAAAVYRKLKDAEKAAEIERRIKEDSK
jgi:hypothetical protein